MKHWIDRSARYLMGMAILLTGAAGASPTVAPTTSPTTATMVVRTPRYPLKTSRALVSDAQIAQAKKNIAAYPAAKRIAAEILKTADKWLAFSDEDIRHLITDSSVPRAFETGTAGCPICGHKMYEKFSQYGWIIDPHHPLTVKCPLCGHVFPDADHPDNGWGWQSPNGGEKYWFVAYANHWMWLNQIVPGCSALSQAYLLTGDPKYAHKAAVMLERVAEVYPAMDLDTQSRYGQMMRAMGQHYPGKVVNAIWETGLVTNLSTAYDGIWDSIDKDSVLQQSLGKTGEQIRSLIEANFLEDAIDAYFARKIRGNFGMHQSALVHLALVRQHGENDKWFDQLMNESSRQGALLGLNYALYNLIYRDGVPTESSPGYNSLWVEQIASYGDLLSRGGRDVFAIPKTRLLFDAILNQICARSSTPSVGDTGSVYAGIVGQMAATFQTAYRHYHDPRYADFLTSFGAAGDGGFKDFNSLLYPPIPAGKKDLTVLPSRLMDGAGYAILNDAADRTAMFCTYGMHNGHGHFDRLNLDLFAGAEPMMPDLGYPDAMNEFVPGIYTWSKNTISHNTVMVDHQRQPDAGNFPGAVQLFADGKFARVLDIDASKTYPQCSEYRRATIMVDAPNVPADAKFLPAYFVDVFNVKGGSEHDYSLHGPPGEFKMIGGKWSAPQTRGTLAGENVALDQIYDDPKLGAKGYTGGFSGYTGSGFQHFFNVQRQQQTGWIAQYTHEKNPHAHLRLRILDQPDQQVMLCEAHVSPVKHPQMLRYLIARRTGKNLASRFVGVFETYGDGGPIIDRVEQLPIVSGVALAVHLTSGEVDYVLYDADRKARRIDAIDASTDAQVAVIRTKDGKPIATFFAGGTSLAVGKSKTTAKPIRGEVESVDPRTSTVRVKLAASDSIDPATSNSDAKLPANDRIDAASLVGRVAHFVNADHRTAHTIQSAALDGDVLTLSFTDDIYVGRVLIDSIASPSTLTTQTSVHLAPTYSGATLTDSAMDEQVPVHNVTSDGAIHLARPIDAKDSHFAAGATAWLLDIGNGDRLEIPVIGEWRRT